MANDVTKVAVGTPKATGGAYVAPLGTALPTTESASLDTAFTTTAANGGLVGLIGSEGVVQTIGTSVTTISDWSGSPVRKVQSEHDVTYALTMLETNRVSQGVYYGPDNVSFTAATVSAGQKLAIKVAADVLPAASWIFELKDGLRTGRVVLPNAQVTDRGAVSFVNNDAVKYPITLTAYPDATGGKGYIYWDDGVVAPA